MSMFNLVIADGDELYLESLSRFLRSSCPIKLHLNIFTQKEPLLDFLKGDKMKIDVLLAAPEMIPEPSPPERIGSIALLWPDGVPDGQSLYPCISKYQPADALLNSLMELYATGSPEFQSFAKANKSVPVLTLFSPQGGTGKSVIALFLSRHFAQMGLRVLYLNLESICSTSFLMAGKAEGLSKLLYYLKGNTKNIALKIDSLKCRDPHLNIDYFSPPDSSLELDELTAEDMEKLMLLLKNCHQFDLILADLDSSVNKKSLAILELSESILLGLVQDPMAQYRLDTFTKDIKRIYGEDSGKILDKIIPFINKYLFPQSDSPLFFLDTAVAHLIPYDRDILLPSGNGFILNQNSSVTAHIGKLGHRVSQKIKLAVKEVSDVF